MVKKATIEGQEIHASSESYPFDGEVTDHPVEGPKGSITDHVSVDRKTIDIEGILTSDSLSKVEKQVEQLRNWQKKGKLLQYEGRRIMQNMVIKKFSIDADVDIANGYNYSMTLVQIEVSESAYQEIDKPVTNEGRKQTNDQNTGKKYHKVKRGDTYWGSARKYGTTVSQLQSWNPWPAREIPIGVDMRVG